MRSYVCMAFIYLMAISATGQVMQKPTATISRLKAKTNFNHGIENKIVDSTILQYTGDRSFDAVLNDWRFDEKKEYDMASGVPVNQTRTTQTFSGDRIATSESEKISAGTWQKEQKNIYLYSSSGQLTEHTVQYWDIAKSMWINSFKFLKTYNNSLVIDSTLQSWDNNIKSWVNIDQTVWTYDAQNRIETILGKQFSKGAWRDVRKQVNNYGLSYDKAYQINLATQDTTSRWTNKYDGNNRLTETEYEQKNNKTWRFSFKESNAYDADGNVSEYLREQYNSFVYEPMERKRMTYNSYNQVLLLTPERWDGTTWIADVNNISGPNYQQRFYYQEAFPAAVENIEDQNISCLFEDWLTRHSVAENACRKAHGKNTNPNANQYHPDLI